IIIIGTMIHIIVKQFNAILKKTRYNLQKGDFKPIQSIAEKHI
ncbi:MAG: hypothetical protein PWQ07_933, partial [Kosmotoga sp.]|nr:hypothetical protein [Kosmotoga sp.]